ncbi:unnamed protein product [Fasciola hepatica]|uniref:Uncharacterized protein n=1 Tax=Fasciola hepatica TaxID=6192 RepID=A0ABC9HH59_FASHE
MKVSGGEVPNVDNIDYGPVQTYTCQTLNKATAETGTLDPSDKKTFGNHHQLAFSEQPEGLEPEEYDLGFWVDALHSVGSLHCIIQRRPSVIPITQARMYASKRTVNPHMAR